MTPILFVEPLGGEIGICSTLNGRLRTQTDDDCLNRILNYYFLHLEARFISTPVGSITNTNTSRRYIAVHLHANGEYAFDFCALLDAYDSSLRGWRIYSPVRTPASRSPVHSHVNGEYVSTRAYLTRYTGSSPRQ